MPIAEFLGVVLAVLAAVSIYEIVKWSARK